MVMRSGTLEHTTEKVNRKFATLGFALYLRELAYLGDLQRQVGVSLPVAYDWRILWDILDYLIEKGLLVAFEDVKGIGIISLDLWLSDVEADPTLRELRINRLPRETGFILGVILTPHQRGEASCNGAHRLADNGHCELQECPDHAQRYGAA